MAISQGIVSHGRKEDLSPPLQISGEELQPISFVWRGCLRLPFFIKQLKAPAWRSPDPSSPATRKQRDTINSVCSCFSLAYI